MSVLQILRRIQERSQADIRAYMKRKKINVLRLLICSAVMCMATVCMLWLYIKGTDRINEIILQISPEKDSMKNTLWLFEKVMYILPVCVILPLQVCFYRAQRGRSEGICIHREGMIEGIVMYIFTFALLLPAVYVYSENHPEAGAVNSSGYEIKETLYFMSRTVQWFMWQAILLISPAVYHGAALSREREACVREKAYEDEEVET